MRKLLPCLLLSMYAACTMIPKYTRPSLPVQEHYPDGNGQTAKVVAADVGWRDFFRDSVLQQLIALALANNRDLRVAIENVAAAQATYRVQRANLLPAVNANAGVDYQRIPGNVEGFPTPIRVNAYSAGLASTSYELDLFGKVRSSVKQRHEQYLSTAEARLNVQITLVSQVASQYLTLLADRESLTLAQQTVAAQQRAYDLLHMTLTQGAGNALVVAQAESTLRTAEASRAQFIRAVALDLDALQLLVGCPLPPALTQGDHLPSLTIFPSLSAGVPSELLERRPDIRAAEHTLLAANANIGVARAAFFPSISLTGSIGTASGSLSSLFGAGTFAWLFQPQITLPIFDGGANLANLDAAKIQKRIEIANYEKAIQSAFRDVADALAGRATYQDQLAAVERLVDADQRYYDLAKMRFDSGVDNFLSVLVAQNSLFAAQTNLVSLRLNQQQNLITLYKALGGGWTEATLSKNEMARERK